MRESSTRNTPLPPSVEKAYHKKCIELKRRLNEIEEANDAARLRKRRIDRSIMKMRLERALLLDRLAKAQRLDVEDSDKSTTPPPTPQERPTRQRRTHRSPQPEDYVRSYQQTPPPGSAMPPHPAGPPLYALQAPHPSGPSSVPQISPTHSQPRPTPARPRNSATVDRRGVAEIAMGEQLPLIHTLPNGTNVLILPDGNPKQPPWTIRDIEPRHHLMSGFDGMSYEYQQKMVRHGYCPYDVHGNPVVLGYDEKDRNLKHIFKSDPEWRDPVVDKVRIDDPLREKLAAEPGPNYAREGAERVLPRHQSGKASADESRRESDSVPASSGSPSGGGGGGGGGGGFTAVNR